MRFGWVLLTQGDRSAQLQAAIDSIREADAAAPITVVHNGGDVDHRLEAVDHIVLAENLGVAGGRNVGWRATNADLVCFLDDDAVLLEGFDGERLRGLFGDRSSLAVVSFRVIDPSTGETARRHIPRVGGAGAGQRFEATSFLGGACAIRRSALEAVDGYWDRLFYSHEETDLSWRLIDHGFDVIYDGGFVVGHTADDPRSRHNDVTRLSSRNRVLIARRNLPFLLRYIYVAVWVVITLVRSRSAREVKAMWQGLQEGVLSKLIAEPMSWSTVLRLTRLGRPPIV